MEGEGGREGGGEVEGEGEGERGGERETGREGEREGEIGRGRLYPPLYVHVESVYVYRYRRR